MPAATTPDQGHLTRSIQVEARGKVAEPKDNINTIISNLRETAERNREQDWLKTNLARFAARVSIVTRGPYGVYWALEHRRVSHQSFHANAQQRF